MKRLLTGAMLAAMAASSAQAQVVNQDPAGSSPLVAAMEWIQGTLLGNVAISQGPNVVRGEKLTVDMTTGVSLVEAGKCAKPPCRVQMLATPSSAKPDAPKQDAAPSREAPRPRSPSGLN